MIILNFGGLIQMEWMVLSTSDGDSFVQRENKLIQMFCTKMYFCQKRSAWFKDQLTEAAVTAIPKYSRIYFGI